MPPIVSITFCLVVRGVLASREEKYHNQPTLDCQTELWTEGYES